MAKKKNEDRRNATNDRNNNKNNADGQDPQLHSLSLAYQTYMRHDEEETNHFEDVCNAFRQYAAFAMSSWVNQQYRLHSLSEIQRSVLPESLKRDTPSFNERASRYKDSVIRNQFCIDCILRHAGVPHSQEKAPSSPSSSSTSATTTTQTITRMTGSDSSMSKVSSVLRSLARDWSIDGRAERDMAYQPILRQVRQYLPIPKKRQMSAPRICVPGSGPFLWFFVCLTCVVSIYRTLTNLCITLHCITHIYRGWSVSI